mmetsp:Transcript_8976/g.24170  ORF Transcript_8976/g.24170 Transcript_8976/m.24170 type:complete len:204 (+) Transcript_8976:300-911(+)
MRVPRRYPPCRGCQRHERTDRLPFDSLHCKGKRQCLNTHCYQLSTDRALEGQCNAEIVDAAWHVDFQISAYGDVERGALLQCPARSAGDGPPTADFCSLDPRGAHGGPRGGRSSSRPCRPDDHLPKRVLLKLRSASVGRQALRPVYNLQGREGAVSVERYARRLPDPIDCMSDQFHQRRNRALQVFGAGGQRWGLRLGGARTA